MQSLSNVIKFSKVMDQGHKEIVTKAEINQSIASDDSPHAMKSYENIGAAIIENARIQSEQIKSDAFIEAQLIEQNAYKQGYEKGSEEGRKQAYNETIEQATQQAELIRSQAEDHASKLIESSKTEYEKYMASKAEEIKALAVTIAEQVLKERLKDHDCINNMIFDAVKTCKDTKVIIIKCNEFHLETVKAEIDNWKLQIPSLNDIFVVLDNYLDNGMVVIEKENGRIEVGIDLSMSKIKEALMD
ncbi:MAG: FliH/SctL family protein [Bacillota bacterium]|nr:FliH/SctL family protein [Bacillota bacterium]